MSRRRGRGKRRRPSSQERILGRDGTTTGPEAAVVAELRYLVGRVERRHGSLPSVVGIVSAIAGEGVTFTTHALAAVLSTDFERSVCVVSLDWGASGQASIHDLLAPWSQAARSLRGEDGPLAEQPGQPELAEPGLPDEPSSAEATPGEAESGRDEQARADGDALVRPEPDDVLDLPAEPWDDEVTTPQRRGGVAESDDGEVWTGEALVEEDGPSRAADRSPGAAPSDGGPTADVDVAAAQVGPAARNDLESVGDPAPGTLPVLSQQSDVDLTWGIADVVRGSVAVDEVLVDTGRPRLWAVPSGVVLVDERPRMANHRGLRDVVADLGRRFDHVLLDLPPVLDASESLPLAGLADACVLVVDQGSTPVQDVQDAQAELTGVRLLGAVLNRSRTKTPNALVRRLVGSD